MFIGLGLRLRLGLGLEEGNVGFYPGDDFSQPQRSMKAHDM